MPGKYGEVIDDFVQEALRIHDAAEQNGLPLRVMGAIAYRIKSPQYVELHEAMGREITDIDLIGYYKQQHKIINLFRDDLGYQYVMPGFIRATMMRDLFTNPKTGGHVDVFYDTLDFNHRIEFKKSDRLSKDNPTIALGDLFLEKTQIVQINAKDLKDLTIMFLGNDVSETDDETKINGSYITHIMGDDWGFYYTCTTNLKKLLDFVPTVGLLSEEQKKVIVSRIQKLLKMIEDVPKTGAWKRRATVGTSKRWYKVVQDLSGRLDAEEELMKGH
ncbi:MAG: hypothetical protein C4K47_00755 [Candidatus Thorarchaeota archaeon]|nr:MAG: hypothetical protein C4K47_00755 [Candidatus Thorarchaeota archaeon]